MRWFVAVEMPAPVRAALDALRRPIEGARWVAAENFHLTLRFIGAADGEQAEDIDRALAGVMAAGFEVRLRGTGTFGNGRRVRALWAGVAASPGLIELQGKVERAAQLAGCAPSGRKYVPHVTLARMDWGGRRRGGIAMGPQLDAFLAAHAGLELAPFAVTSFALISSVLTQDGPHYTPEARYDLAAP